MKNVFLIHKNKVYASEIALSFKVFNGKLFLNRANP
jgi:hypothetical protein